MEAQVLDQIIARYDSPSGRVIGILGEVQHREGYIPRDVLEALSERLEIPLSELYSVVTFYALFSLKPVGEHLITVCMGTACHVKGAVSLLERLQDLLNLEGEAGEDGKFSLTTEDNRFTLEIARCFGACSIAPVLRVDGDLYGYVTPESLPGILEGYGWTR